MPESMTGLYDDAMFDFSRGEFGSAVEKFKTILEREPGNFEARLALGMAFYRLGNFSEAIAEGHKAEALRPRDQLVHTNLSLFYQKAGDRTRAEHHGLQARIASWREEAGKAPGAQSEPSAPELRMARTPPPPVQFPSQPWKKRKSEDKPSDKSNENSVRTGNGTAEQDRSRP
ncbi:MAG: tetratricopeptide repeat protein [Verrucomicrobiota bacterium]|nr:tetratricopeptide repeat protein [Verrucomicrobiota bacterium]